MDSLSIHSCSLLLMVRKPISPIGNVWFKPCRECLNLFEAIDGNGLAVKIAKAERILNNTISLYNNAIDGKVSISYNSSKNELLVALCSDLWELVDACRRISKDNPNYVIANKAINIWNNQIKPLLKKLDNLIIIYNNKYSKSIPTIEKRIGIPIREEKYDS